MALTEYKRKRHFEKTPEPAGARRSKAAAGATLSFVVQKHAASRLHYDFRLEMGGVLKSWAVPKGPSLDPADRCLAVEVEDHPIEYGGFEGIIPQGEYGGGTVMLWDRGTWRMSGEEDPLRAWRAGKLSFELFGTKLKGKWLLVKMRPRRPGDKNQWLLRKLEDEYARPASEYDVRSEADRSVASKRSMDAIAKAADRTWATRKSSTATKSATPTSRSKKPATVAHSPAISLHEQELDPASIPGATKRPFPREIDAELATLVSRAPGGSEWIHEVKFDGYRILAHASDGNVRLISRNGKDWTDRFSDIAAAVRKLKLESAVLDGEVVALDDRGISSFQALQGELKGRGAALSYYVFDLPYFGGYDLRQCTLEDRRQLLRDVLDRADASAGGQSRVRFSEAILGHGSEVFHNACRLAMEGVVSKRLDSIYRGERTQDWVKSKCITRQELVIGGYTDPQRSRTALGALLLGYYKGEKLLYAGKVGTGFDEQSLKHLLTKLRPLEQKTTPFTNPPRGAEARGAHWVRPALVSEVEFTQWTNDGRLRHPSFTGLREDKDPREVVRELARSTPQRRSASSKRIATPVPRPKERAKTSRKSPASAKDTASDESRSGASILGVTLTHPEKILYPDQQVTKRRLAEYYAAVGDRMIEQIKGRPLMLVRCPAGQESKCFHQKNWEEELPRGTHGLTVKESSTTNQYVVVEKPAGLVWLVQRGVLEIHNWSASEKDLEHPDRLVFDLDPAPDVDWPTVREAAEMIRDLLEQIGLESFVKTTGGKGLHVVAPLQPKAGWDDVKTFAHRLASDIEQKNPKAFIATMSKAKRTGKIFIDYLRGAILNSRPLGRAGFRSDDLERVGRREVPPGVHS
jgi:bifunctional non-homologous end joining protein LigD